MAHPTVRLSDRQRGNPALVGSTARGRHHARLTTVNLGAPELLFLELPAFLVVILLVAVLCFPTGLLALLGRTQEIGVVVADELGPDRGQISLSGRFSRRPTAPTRSCSA